MWLLSISYSNIVHSYVDKGWVLWWYSWLSKVKSTTKSYSVFP